MTGFPAKDNLLHAGIPAGAANALEAQVLGMGPQAPGLFGAMGNSNVQISSAGVNPGATGADNVVAVYTIPANAFNVANATATIQAAGSFAANGNTKRVKIFIGCTTATIGSTVVGGTAIADTGAVTTNGGGWSISANVAKYGATGSNTQQTIHTQAQVGGAVAALLAPALLTLNESAAILVAVTINNTTNTTDAAFNWFESTWSN